MEETFYHYFIYKPYRMLSQLGTEGYKGKKGLAELFPFPKGVYPIGRLDEDSEGLLLMSSNGKLVSIINSAKFEKEYWVQLDGDITPDAIAQMQNGLTISIKKELVQTKPCVVIKLNAEPQLPPRHKPSRAGQHRPSSWISIVLTEGKHRQIRKMTSAVGFPTMRLVRVRVGNLNLGNLESGEVKSLPDLLEALG
jgi:23S rRNA pseudouridine2457 synthase